MTIFNIIGGGGLVKFKISSTLIVTPNGGNN